MHIALVAVGRPKQSGLADAIREYETRAGRYWTLEISEVKDVSARGLSPDLVREREGERVLQRLATDIQTHSRTRMVACDPGGDALSSDAFAGWLVEQRDAAHRVAFVIGGAYGLSDQIRTRSYRRLSLAPWTLPHELARLVLAEQLYRAGTIVRGEPYHK